MSGLIRSRFGSRMQLSAVISALLLLCPCIIAQRAAGDTVYFLGVTSQAVGGATEKLCVTVQSPQRVSLEVILQYNQSSTSVLKEALITDDYYKCAPFQVPLSREQSVAFINIQIKGRNKFENKTTKILITPPAQLTIIKTDKPIYKPGQTVKFRIVSLDANFFTYNRTFSTIELRDPNWNLIGQWLKVSTKNGLVDLSYPINSEATNGFYTITVWDKDQQITEQFEVKDYVLPTFEVTVQLPPVITILDTTATLKVCAKYTYGKPVNGTVRAVVCYNSYMYYWRTIRRPWPSNICKNYTMMTDRTGCGQTVLNLNEFAVTNSGYNGMITAKSEVEEHGTGLIMKGSGSSSITAEIVRLSFEDSPSVFRPGLAYEGKVKVTDPQSNPVKGKSVYVTVTYSNNGNNPIVLTLVTNNEGITQFSINTESWGTAPVSLQAQHENPEKSVINDRNIRFVPPRSNAYLWVQPFYSKSRSFIELKRSSAPFSCDRKANVVAQYLIHDTSYKPFFIIPHRALYVYYMVMSRGHLVQQGRLSIPVTWKQEIRGNVSLTLENVDKLSPVAQVVMYTILSNGEAVADSMDFPVELCLTNKVSANFTTTSELPGDQASLNLKAAPGSLCSVRAIDKSLLLLQPESELSIQSVFNMLPVQTLSGYPYNTYDEDPCGRTPYYAYYGQVDVYKIFEKVGIKILTNAEVRNTSACSERPPTRTEGILDMAVMRKEFVSTAIGPIRPVTTVRKYFPETWIWDLVPVSQSGMKTLTKTVPDSITTWQADVFCTSPVGFGVAPKTELTAFQPFFVSLTMPSSVIRGEVFTLKATVFNYLQSCMMVDVILADSKQFSAEKCKDCSYKLCLCAEESWTFSWTITPRALGEVAIKVTAEAVKSSVLCGKKAVFVPQKGRIDTVIKTLRVQAEGTKQYKSYNELLCPSGSAIQKTVSLTLPNIIVNDSATAFVSVLGDLMGRALQNLASLLAMPYGCGEQNMLRFAPNIFILQYLESTNQLTPEVRSTAESYLVSGYQRELSYKHSDGSYSAFGMNDASGNTWLTAFVMKSFGSAKRYIFIDQVFVDQAKVWLGQQQQPNGCFASVGQLFHSELKGGVNDEVTLSAYITAAMLELNYTTADPVVSSGLQCLRNVSSQVNSTYTKTLLFYTFTLAGDQQMRNTLMSNLDSKAIVSGGRRHWSRVNDGSVTDSLEVEMTSYVLLALMSGPQISGFDLGYSTSIVQWLSQQQNAFGGFASTQDTVVALQALAKYSSATYSPSESVNVIITSPSGLIKTFNITQSNRLLYQESQLQEVTGNYSIKAQGQGCVYVQFSLRYNIPPPADYTSFTVSATASGNCRVPNPQLVVSLTVIYNGKRPRTNMVVIEVRPLSGFRADRTSVQLVNGNPNSNDGAVKRVDEIEGNIIIYLDGLMRGVEKEYSLLIIRDDTVENLKPGIVKVYDYYETSDVAVTQYPSPCIVQ